MIIYHAANASCFLKCLLHKCIYHSTDDATFIGYSWLFDKFFKPDDLFSKVLGYSPLLGPSGKCNDESVEKAEKKIKHLFNDMLSKNKIELSKCSEIYIGSYYSEFPNN